MTAELAGASPGGSVTTTGFVFKNALRVVFGRFRRYGYAIVNFGEPIEVGEFAREHPALLRDRFEERKPGLEAIARELMSRISASLPVTPVTLLARIFAAHPDRPLSEAEILRAIEAERSAAAGRVWLIREHAASEIWRAARRVLRLRRLIELGAAGWRWNPSEMLLRDYYANALVPFAEVEARGWPRAAERRPTHDESGGAITAAAPSPRFPSP